MGLDIAILLAAAGITTLEMTEAGAVGVALFFEFRTYMAFVSVAVGTLVVLVPAVFLGSLIALLPLAYVKIVGGALLLYFGLRLTKSARRSVILSRRGTTKTEQFGEGIFITGFSVGAVEAFEAAIVLVGLIPNSFASAVLGMGIGAAVVILATYLLRSRVRKVKQAKMKIVVAGLLLSFSVFWFTEAALPAINDVLLIPLFAAFAFAVYRFANGATPDVAALESV